MNRSTWAVAAWVGVSTLGCTCNHVPSRGTTAGELGKGVFIYRCVDATDAACPFDGDKPADFPAYVAVGSRFEVLYEALEDGHAVTVSSPTSQVVSDGLAFTAIEPGWAAIVANEGTSMLDLVHIEVVEPDELILSADAVTVAVGEPELLLDAGVLFDGEVVAGALPYEWTADPPGIVELLGDEPTDRVGVRGISPGLVTVTVSDGTREVWLELEILPGDGDTGLATGSTGDTAGVTP